MVAYTLAIIKETMNMEKSIFIFSIILSSLLCSFAFANEYEDWLQNLNVPIWVRNTFQKSALNKKYVYIFRINPMYLRGDFNGDNKPDVAILVKEKSSKKFGIIVIHFGSNDYFVLGAGEKIGNGGDNFHWMTNWAVKRKEEFGQKADDKPSPHLKAESIYVEKAESASGIIHWNGTTYSWYQQGD